MTPGELAAAAAFRALRPEVTEAAYAMVQANLDSPEPMSLVDATLGATLAALHERGWLTVPTQQRRAG